MRTLQRTTHELNRALEDELRDIALSPAEANTLACFDDDRPRRMGDLVAETAQRASTLTGVVDRLERRGLLRRGVDAQDRRALQVALTEEGRTARDVVRSAYAGIADRASTHLDAQPRLVPALQAIEQAARKRRR